jgi:hypothetical protein
MMRTAYKVMIEKHERKTPLGSPGHSRVILKFILKEESGRTRAELIRLKT